MKAFLLKQKRMRRGNYNGGGEGWKELRKRVLCRDGHKCRKCGRSRSQLKEGEYFEIHHIIEISKGGSDDMSNLKTLCSTCHAKHHRHMKGRNHDKTSSGGSRRGSTQNGGIVINSRGIARAVPRRSSKSTIRKIKKLKFTVR